MTVSSLPPGLILIAAGLLLPLAGPRMRQGLIVGAPLLALWWVWQIPDGVHLRLHLLDLAWMFPGADLKPGAFDLELVRGDRLARLFGTVFAVMAFAGGLFALPQNRTTELSAAYCYAGAALGVAFAGDIISVFIFWEIMAIGSTLVIWSAATSGARSAGLRYAAIHLLGGVILMAGIADYIIATQSIAFGGDAIQNILGFDRPGTWLILAGFLINAGAPPFSAWLPDAYPETSWSGMVFLSAFTTKTAVLVLIRGFPGMELLIWVGLYMIFYGIIYALLENDMRRILAYSIVNQVGFMVCGVGLAGSADPEFNRLALNGAASHAFTHIIYKALLLMSAGSVLYMTGKRKCTDLGGLFRTMPLTMICGTIGALSISSFPATSGFISKSMISSAAAEQHLLWVWLALTAASAGVFLHAGIKFPWFVFFQKDSGLRPPEPPRSMRGAMVLFAFLCIFLGVYPDPLYAILPYPVSYVPYTAEHVVTMLQLLLFSGLAFFLLLPLMKRTLTLSLDVDWFYRKFGTAVAREFGLQGAKLQIGVFGLVLRFLERGHNRLLRVAGPQSRLARTWQTAGMVGLILILMAVYLAMTLV